MFEAEERDEEGDGEDGGWRVTRRRLRRRIRAPVWEVPRENCGRVDHAEGCSSSPSPSDGGVSLVGNSFPVLLFSLS